MSAAGIIILILFVIAVLMALYYAMLCFDRPDTDKKKPFKIDEGPLLQYENDYNGNQDVSIPIGKIDEPDAEESDASLDRESVSAENKVTLISIESDDASENTPVIEEKQSNVANKNSLSKNDSSLSKSDEEDGLVLPSAPPAVVSITPKKHVRFGSDTNSTGEASVDPPSDADEDDVRIPIPTPTRPVITDIDALKKRWNEANKGSPSSNDNDNEKDSPKIIESYYGKDSKILHNPTDDIKVKVLVPSDSVPSSTEELASPSDTDTSEPEVTEYSFESGPLVPSTSNVLANEIGHCSDPKVTGIKQLSGSAQLINSADINNKSNNSHECTIKPNFKDFETTDTSSGEDTPTIISTSSFTDDTYNTAPTTADHSYNTPPKTPPDGYEFTIIENPSAVMSKSRDQRSPTFIVVNTHRKNSSTSNSSLSSDEYSPNPQKNITVTK